MWEVRRSMEHYTKGDINVISGKNPKILVVADVPSQAVWERGSVMTVPAMKVLGSTLKSYGFTQEDLVLVTPSMPVPEEIEASDKKVKDHIMQSREQFLEAISEYLDVKCIVSMGKWGNYQLHGKPCLITKIRGSFTTCSDTGDIPVLPVFSSAHILKRPEAKDIFDTDLGQLIALRDAKWDIGAIERANADKYKWCLDLQPLIDNPPDAIALDCETIGLDWHTDKSGFRVLTVSLTTAEGNAYVVPTDVDYFNDEDLRGDRTPDKKLTKKTRDRLVNQLKLILGRYDSMVVGHNLSFDLHALRTIGVEVSNWYADTMQMAFCVDDNMQLKSLSECVRRWCPEIAGYSDEFDTRVDKSRMDLVHHDDMLEYAGGDTDATYRLAKCLTPIAKRDVRNWGTYTTVQMPALRAFFEVENRGVKIDKDRLREVSEELRLREEEEYKQLIALVPKKVLRMERHIGKWSFGRADFISDILFTREGFNLTPLLWTDSTKKAIDKSERKASTSSKHLAYFEEHDFVSKLLSFKKLSKMRSTYVGEESALLVKKLPKLKNGGYGKKTMDILKALGIELPKSKAVRDRSRLRLEIPSDLTEGKIPMGKGKYLKMDEFGNCFEISYKDPSGFWQYLKYGDIIHPSFVLHATVTGRTASRNPNAQNFPKRGELAKMFRSIFVPREGYVFCECDLSQAEVRLAAWQANETEMLSIYNAGGDIHSATASAVTGIPIDQFLAGRSDKETMLVDVVSQWAGAAHYLNSLDTDSERAKASVAQYCDYKRYQAKAVVFGFLYGMGWRGFQTYAKVDYGIEFTDEEAKNIRQIFFSKYKRLSSWHTGMKKYVRSHGYVRALHGALRRLPSIYSDDDGVQAACERQAVNSPIQRFASDLGLMAMARLVRDVDLDMMRPIMFIHDALVVEIKKEHVVEGASALKYYMETNPLKNWFNLDAPLPIVSDASIGEDNFAEVDEDDSIEAIKPEWYGSGLIPPTDTEYSEEDLNELWQWRKELGIVLGED